MHSLLCPPPPARMPSASALSCLALSRWRRSATRLWARPFSAFRGNPRRVRPPPSQRRGGPASRRIWQVHLARIHFARLRAYGLERDCLRGLCGGLCPSAARSEARAPPVLEPNPIAPQQRLCQRNRLSLCFALPDCGLPLGGGVRFRDRS
eukprot:4429684-Alexandrium_andersonii.AAC.1